jgi:N-methylhydantoinase B
LPGGGGFGDPFRRDPRAVLEDAQDGLVSIEAAREAYGVVIDADAWEVDGEATAQARSNHRE